MATGTDPREHLVATGNKLLDVIYQLEEHADYLKAINHANTLQKGSREAAAAATALVSGDGLEKMLAIMTLSSERETLLREYVAVRRTLEALV